MEKVFIFDFSVASEENNNIGLRFIMPISSPKIDKIEHCGDKYMDELIDSGFLDDIQKITDILETKYGVHDWSTGQHSQRIEIVGYNTYEVECNKILKLLEEWKTHLTNDLNIVCGKWSLDSVLN